MAQLVKEVGDLGVAATCPPDCPHGTNCTICMLPTCPDHGVPCAALGESVPESTHLADSCLGTTHRACHASFCRDDACWQD